MSLATESGLIVLEFIHGPLDGMLWETKPTFSNGSKLSIPIENNPERQRLRYNFLRTESGRPDQLIFVGWEED